MKFSVIIPIYKVEQYLSKCIDSVLAQTFEDYELILVDDGSPDNCGAICDDYAATDHRIKVIHKENGGLSSARNAGLDVAQGEYIYFLDSDDYIAPELLETVVPYMDDGLDMVAFNFSCIDEKRNSEIWKTNHAESLFDLSSNDKRELFIISKLLCGKIGWEAWSRVFRRSVIEENGIRFADNRKIFAEDMYFSLCYCAKAKKIVSINAVLYYYLSRNDSIMRTDSKKSNIGRMNELSKAVYEYWSSQSDCKELLRVFSAVHFYIIQNAVDNYMNDHKISIKELRRLCIEDVEDQRYFKKNFRKLSSQKKWLYFRYSGSCAAELISNWRYCIDGFYPALVIRNRLIYRFADRLNMRTPFSKELISEYKSFVKNSKRVYFLGSEEFGNIGDHKINEAIVSFVKTVLPNAAVKEITLNEMHLHFPLLKKYIKPDDIIISPGGGNCCDTYWAVEVMRQQIIAIWPDNLKIVFPQTVHFSDTEKGRDALDKAKKTYTNENNVVFFAREKVSYDFVKSNFTCKSYLVPDIVLSCIEVNGSVQRKGITLCMRKDVEKAIDNEEEKKLFSYVSCHGGEVRIMDLQLDYHISKSNRKEIIDNALIKMQSSQLVITDRLHGMVFAAITQTPCIALGNYNHKVRGTYEWIRHLPYIRFAEDISDVEALIPELLAVENCYYDNSKLLRYYDKIKKELS